ncbi:MAG: tRNA (guanine-N7)-methyltransferase, partial [Candidatus Delongbacteria bacterium]|nr:tRNA (guanine-N7)-methyltransferase [Candidatus Delongbacteria bacterium]
DEIIMNFPDPWPKAKHHKNRTVNEEFLAILHRLLKESGVFRFSSDHEEYSFEVIDIFKHSKLFSNLYHPDQYKSEINDRIETQFEKHKKREGFTIHHIKYLKV